MDRGRSTSTIRPPIGHFDDALPGRTVVAKEEDIPSSSSSPRRPTAASRLRVAAVRGPGLRRGGDGGECRAVWTDPARIGPHQLIREKISLKRRGAGQRIARPVWGGRPRLGSALGRGGCETSRRRAPLSAWIPLRPTARHARCPARTRPCAKLARAATPTASTRDPATSSPPSATSPAGCDSTTSRRRTPACAAGDLVDTRVADHRAAGGSRRPIPPGTTASEGRPSPTP